VTVPSDEELRATALDSLKRKRGFAKHLRAYVIVNAFLWAVYVLTAIQSHEWWPWPLVVMAGWGIGLGLNAWSVYGRAARPISEDEIRREVARQRGAGGS